MSRNNSQQRELICRGGDAANAARSSTTAPLSLKYIPPPAPGRKSEDDLTMVKIRSTLVCTTDRSISDNVYELHDSDNISHMRMWLVCESVKDELDESLNKVHAALERLKSSKSCVVANLACTQFATPVDRLSRSECEKIDKLNTQRHDHNRLLTRLLNDFVAKNGCGTSAGHVTHPSQPTLYTENIGKQLADAQKDTLQTTSAACTYLQKAGVLPMLDYEIQDAVKVADAVAYYRAACVQVAEIQQKNPPVVHLRIPGYAPSTWTGVDDADSAGSQVRWGANETHKFWHPDVFVSFVSDADPSRTIMVYGQDNLSDSSSARIAFGARARYAADVQQLLKTSSGKAAVIKFCVNNLSIPEAVTRHALWLMHDIADPAQETSPPPSPTLSHTNQDAAIPSASLATHTAPPISSSMDRTPQRQQQTTQRPMPSPVADPFNYMDDSPFNITTRQEAKTAGAATTYSLSGTGVGARVSDIDHDMEEREREFLSYNISGQGFTPSYDPGDIFTPEMRIQLAKHGRQ